MTPPKLRSPLSYELCQPFVLVGLPGVGKSFLANRLARFIDAPILDTDTLVERRLGVDISWVFDREGEEGFRVYETKALKEALALRPFAIIASGGGIVLKEENRAELCQKAFVVHVVTDNQKHVLQLRTQKRPLFWQKDPSVVLKNLQAQREPIYRQLADITWNSKNLNVSLFVQKLLKQGVLRKKNREHHG